MAAGNTYTQIASTTLGSNSASVTFSSIPSTYTDIVLIFSGQVDASNSPCYRVNGDSGTNYSNTILRGVAGTVSSVRISNQTELNGGVGMGTNVQTNAISHFMNYANTTTYKTVLYRGNNAGAAVGTAVGLWRSTAAINSISVVTPGFNMNAGTVISIYGITAA